MNLRDLAILDAACARPEELIHACRPRGPLYCHDRVLTIDVIRKAKILRASLTRLRDAAYDSQHQPSRKETPMRQQSRQLSLSTRLYLEPALYELARFISYGGRRAEAVKDVHDRALQEHGPKILLGVGECFDEDVAV